MTDAEADAPADAPNFGQTGVPTRAGQRDLTTLRPAVEAWLRQRLGTDLAVDDVRLPVASGVANETILVDARVGDAAQGFVVRIAPGDFLYKDVDLSVHAGMYEALADVPGVPVPPVVGYDEDPAIFGSPFFVMERIDGRVPGDTPPFHTAGWVTELDTAERERMWRDAVAVMARLHQVGAERFPFLQRPHLGSTGLEQDMRYWFDYRDWALGSGEPHPAVVAGERWLHDNLPADPPTALAWGDSRVGNMIFRDGEVVAVLDWDMVSLAGPESDLAWWAIMDLLNTASAGVERLPGIGSPEDTFRLWREETGRDTPDLWFHLVYAAYRMAVILTRLGHLLGDRGDLPPEHAAELVHNNSGIQYLATMLELPYDGNLTTPWPGLEL